MVQFPPFGAHTPTRSFRTGTVWVAFISNMQVGVKVEQETNFPGQTGQRH